jgi:transposase
VLPAALAAAARAHPDQRIALYFQDEARFGQKGRCCWRWWLRGRRPSGPVDQRHDFVYVFAAIEPITGRDFCLALPAVRTEAMAVFLRQFAATLPVDEHALMVLDGAGWHTARDLAVPDNVTLLRLPPYTPELNPVERVWLYLRERHLSHRVMDTYSAIVDAVCHAWRQLTPERLRSLCGYPWIKQVIK